jgi:1,4-dihydroxy-2-naphthoyl-CoA hydrolase
MVEHLGIQIVALEDNGIVGTMPVDQRTKQPLGLLHGGASVALAESLGSTAANLVINPDEEYCVGLEINANHISSCRDGLVTGRSTPIHLGKTTQLWETRIYQDSRLVCISRLTMMVLKKKK